jgi:hypothetical protein
MGRSWRKACYLIAIGVAMIGWLWLLVSIAAWLI